MATGTGKTITSLNCLLEIYNKLGYYTDEPILPALVIETSIHLYITI